VGAEKRGGRNNMFNKKNKLITVEDVHTPNGIIHASFVDVSSVGPPEKEDLLVAFIIPSLDGKINYSLMHLWSIVALHIKYLILCQSEETYLSYCRNKLIDYANEVGATTINRLPDYYLFLDEDSVVHPNVFDALKEKIEKYSIDFVSANYIRKNRHIPVFTPLKYYTEWNQKHKWKIGDLVEVITTGGGCLLAKGESLRKIPPPWFRLIEETDKKPVLFGEDAYFCQKCREYGMKVYVATDIPIGHKGSVVYPAEWEKNGRKPRDPNKMWSPKGGVRR